MQRIAALATVIVALSICLLPLAHGAEQDKGYIYDKPGSGKRNDMAMVIDVTQHWINVQGKSDARIGSLEGDFDVGYYDCGNDAFYCMTRGLEIVVPKAMPKTRWTYHGSSCEAVTPKVGDTYQITCRSREYLGQTIFTYSLARGVVSIDNSSVAGDIRFELRGERGLFAPGNSP